MLEYPAHSEYMQYKKGQPRFKYSSKNKRALQIEYDAKREKDPNIMFPYWKKDLYKVLGMHAHPREVPGDNTCQFSIQRFREGSKIYLMGMRCLLMGYLSKVMNLNVPVEIILEGDKGGGSNWIVR